MIISATKIDTPFKATFNKLIQRHDATQISIISRYSLDSAGTKCYQTPETKCRVYLTLTLYVRGFIR